ncbi:NACHT domain-containing protein [Streptomyces nigra]|uniref:NACHT domain-containing protein n=1 Tax=Streptomyces nigra TaxID=1827580 RepID=UPI003825A14D
MAFKPGEEFERDVRSILALRGDIQITEHKRIGGKDVDIVCEARSPIGSVQTIVFECKDYQRALSRERVANEMSGYWPLLQNGDVDQIVLVTRKGIVANARPIFDGKKTLHLTLADLTGQILRPEALVRSMIDSFEQDLSNYYMPTRCRAIDLNWVAANHRLLHSDFVTFAEQSGLLQYAEAAEQWVASTRGTAEESQPTLYTESSFRKVLAARTSSQITQLEPLVQRWLRDDRITQSLAVIGSYGTGKSSFARKLAHSCAVSFDKSATGRIPLLIELRNFGGHQTIEGLVIHEIQQRYGTAWTFQTFKRLNESGRLLLILDGFDEMKHGMTQEALFHSFEQIGRLSKGKAKVIICGRPTVFSSDEEQAKILVGKPATYIEQATGYLQIDIAPFSHEDTITFLRRFCLSRTPSIAGLLETKLPQLQRLASENDEIARLLARPVHLPMIAELIPNLEISADSLKRAKVYEGFIQLCIEREIRKQAAPRPSAEEHARFAQELALTMLRSGESRSVRYSEVTDVLVLPFLRKGQEIDECRRELISACFLERKAPDVLYFPHKSFAEFLVAQALLRRVRLGTAGTSGLGTAMSAEVVSFFQELATHRDMRALVLACGSNVELLERLITVKDSRVVDLLHEPEIVDSIGARILELPKLLLFQIFKLWRTYVASEPRIRTVAEQIAPYLDGALKILVTELTAPDDPRLRREAGEQGR